MRKPSYCPEVKKARAVGAEHLAKAHNLAHSVMCEVCGIQGHLGYPSGGVLPGQGIVGGSSSIELCSGRKEQDVSVDVHAEQQETVGGGLRFPPPPHPRS